MAKLSGNLNIQAGSKNYNMNLLTSDYKEVFDLEQTLDNTSGFSGGMQFDPTAYTLNSLKSAKLIVINNPSTQPIEIQFKLNDWTIATSFTDATCDYDDDPTITHDVNSAIKTGLLVSGTGIPEDAMIGSITDTTHFELVNAKVGAALSTTGGAVTNGTLTFSGQSDQTDASSFAYPTTIIRPKEFMVLPSNQFISYSANSSAGDTGTYTLAKADTGYALSGVHLASAVNTSSGTTLTLSAAGAYSFQVGDIIQLGKGTTTANNYREVMEVVSIDTTTTMTVKRGQFGTTAGDSDDASHDAGHAALAPVYFSYYNTNQNVGSMINGTDVEIVATDISGKFASKFIPLNGPNLQKIRNNDNEADGLVRGSVAIQFYTEGAYQELGMSGVTSSTNSGLTASTDYEFDIQVDGDTNFDNLTFTTSSNTKFGGSDGVIRKIQDALDVQYYTTSSNLLKKGVSVTIVNGDIRFTSKTNWSTSAIALTAGSSGAAEFFGTGSIPAVGSIEAAIPSDTPDETIIIHGITKPNESGFAYDDGYGNIYGICKGTIDYSSSALTLTGAPPESEFKIAFNYDSALSAGNNDNPYHSLRSIVVRSINQYKNATVQLLAFS